MYLLICFLLPSFISLQLERKMLSENDKNMNKKYKDYKVIYC